MWPVLAVVAGVVGVRIIRGLVASSGDGDAVDEKQNSAFAGPNFSIAWAYVPFDTDSSMGKVRPVLLLDSNEETITVLELRSERGPTTETMTWTPVSAESARTFDHKEQTGWVKVARPRVLPSTSIRQHERPLGCLTDADARLAWAAMLEYVL